MEICYILCKIHMYGNGQSKYGNTSKYKAQNLCTIYFVFDLDDERKFIKTKHHSD